MDYEKLLRAYIRHVTETEGTDFLPSWAKDRLISEGLTDEEAQHLIHIGEQEWPDGPKVM